MSDATSDISLNLARNRAHDLQPVPRFVSLVIRQALDDGAQTIEFSLEDSFSDKGLRIKYSGKVPNYEMAPMPGILFDPAVVVLCNYASVPYYAAGSVQGTLHTSQPDSRWRLESDNLRKHVVLEKT